MKALAADIEFTLHGPRPAGQVGVRLRRSGERWVADLANVGAGTGMGPTARAALTAALQPMGQTATDVMLADLALLGPSLRVMESE